MRRTLAGLLFGLAYLCASVALAGFLLQRSALEPSRSSSSPDVVLQDKAIRSEIVNTIADAAASQLHQDDASLRALVDLVARHPDGWQFFSPLIHDAHAALLGHHSGAVQLTGEQLVPILRMEAAATMAPVTFVVPRLRALDLVHTLLRWLIPIAAIATIVFVALGLTAHPDTGALMHSLALGMVLLAVLVVIVGYLVPRFGIPALSTSPWANISARLANDDVTLVVALVAVLLVGAGALLLGTSSMQRRRRWSSPVSTYRYTEERHWS
ncbi:MAG: hypothetical protein WCI22_04330 [Actinomycetota bacterium]